MKKSISGYSGGSKQFQRVANLALVMNVIRREQPISRSDIARALGLDRSTITHITSRLLDEGCIRIDSEGDAGSKGGRKPTLLAIENDWGYTLGIDLTPGDCRAIAMDLGGEPVWSSEDPFPGYGERPEKAALDAVTRLANEARAQLTGRRNRPLVGIGIAVPGLVEPSQGRVIESRALGLVEYELLPAVASKTGLPVLVDNDARCCAYGELSGGHDSFLFVLGRYQPDDEESRQRLKPSGMGIGVGLAIDGRVNSGANHASGEFRSMHWREGLAGQLGLSPEELPRMQTDAGVLRRGLTEVLSNLIPVISIVDPSEVIFGGEFRRRSEIVAEILAGELHGSYAAPGKGRWSFRPSRHGEWEVAAGAARMFLDQLFSVPVPAGGSGTGTVAAEGGAVWEDLFRNTDGGKAVAAYAGGDFTS